MKILQVTSNTVEPSEAAMKAEHGMITALLSPTLLSAMTALKIAKAVDRLDIDIIEVERQEDAMAAISSRNISDKKDVRIVYHVRPNVAMPRHWHKEVTDKVDGWVFASDRLRQAVSSNLRSYTIIQPTILHKCQLEMPDMSKKPITFAMIGILRNTWMLKRAMDAIDNLGNDVSLRISGAGVARDVMPAVRHARALPNSHRIVWVGEEYDLAAEINRCHCAIQCDGDISDIESLILSSGRMVIKPEQVDAFAAHPQALGETVPHSIEQYLTKLREYYHKLL